MAIYEAEISICSECEEYKKLKMNGVLVLEGDCYHNKIGYKIDGYILGVEDLGHEVLRLEDTAMVCEDCKEIDWRDIEETL